MKMGCIRFRAFVKISSFSFVGMATQDIHFTGQPKIDIVMQEDAVGLDQVAATALGLNREKKALGFSVGEATLKHFITCPIIF